MFVRVVPNVCQNGKPASQCILTLDCCILACAASLASVFVLLAAGQYKVKGLVGGLPPATALWNVKLALAYYSTSQAQLLSDLSTLAGSFPGVSYKVLHSITMYMQR